jgi:hypothetical protein
MLTFIKNIFADSRTSDIEAAASAIKAALASGDRMALSRAINASGAAIRA